MGQADPESEMGLIDLTDIPLDQIEEMGESVLANSVRVLFDRLHDGRLPLESWNSGI